MKILLINNNPVVSRLTALSARKENIEIDEIQEVTELNSDGYDIVFVDADSLTKDVNDTIEEHLKVKKSVLFYTEGDEEDKVAFDLTILKPFLPSEVSSVIRSVEEMEEEEEERQEDKHFNVLDEAKVSNTEELFALNDVVEIKDKPADAEIKDSFDEKLEEAFPLKINTLEDELFEEKEETVGKDEVFKKDEELFALDISDEKITLDDELFAKEATLTNEKLDFEADTDKLKLYEIESEEKLLTVEEEPLIVLEDDKEKIEESLTEEVREKEKLEENVAETKILDGNEIDNIKGLLTEDTNNEMTLDNLMTPPMIVETSEDEEKKSKKKKEKKENSSVESDVLVQSLAGLSVEALRELLAGARVNINIKFPKAK